MPKLDLTPNEQQLINDSIEQSISSATRQQNMKGKTPMMIEVYKQHEQLLRQLQIKVGQAK